MTEIVSSDETHSGAQHFCRTVRSVGRVPGRGCSSQAAVRATRRFSSAWNSANLRVGVDMVEQWDPSLGADVPDFRLLAGSILEPPFADGTFDGMASYHYVIDHVDDTAGSLRDWPGSCVRTG